MHAAEDQDEFAGCVDHVQGAHQGRPAPRFAAMSITRVDSAHLPAACFRQPMPNL
jgi:hypothetical protein